MDRPFPHRKHDVILHESVERVTGQVLTYPLDSKTRWLLWEKRDQIAHEFAKVLEDVGAVAVDVCGMTVENDYWEEASRKIVMPAAVGYVITLCLIGGMSDSDDVAGVLRFLIERLVYKNNIDRLFARTDPFGIVSMAYIKSDWQPYHFLDTERPQEDLTTMPYVDYLRTEHWQDTRAAALHRAGHRCQVCNGDERLEVHHRTYERRGEELPEDLTVLCADCHRLFHAPTNGKVTRMPTATERKP